MEIKQFAFIIWQLCLYTFIHRILERERKQACGDCHYPCIVGEARRFESTDGTIEFACSSGCANNFKGCGWKELEK